MVILVTAITMATAGTIQAMAIITAMAGIIQATAIITATADTIQATAITMATATTTVTADIIRAMAMAGINPNDGYLSCFGSKANPLLKCIRSLPTFFMLNSWKAFRPISKGWKAFAHAAGKTKWSFPGLAVREEISHFSLRP